MIRFGIDQFLEHRSPRSARLGLVTNDAARLAADVTVKSRQAMLGAGFNLVRLFSPEHGIGAAARDGAAVGDSIDALTGLPVVSLYGQRVRPAPESLHDLDIVLFDIPDIGARFYTYIWTLSHVIEACAAASKPLWVLDRPNPLGGDLGDCEGPMLDESRAASFIGRWSIPIRHGLTAGELAQVWNTKRKLGCDLTVCRCEGWRREMRWPDTGLPFVATSPAINSYENALTYPGVCFFEGTNLSEGRGTDRPMRWIGAPWLDAVALAAEFDRAGIPGLRLVPATRTPSETKHAGRRCEGVEWQVTDPRALRPVAAALHAIAIIAAQHPAEFAFEPYPTAANPTGGSHFDRLAGTEAIRQALIDDPGAVSNHIGAWTSVSDWSRTVGGHLIYD